jgi:hypothetical protein
MKNLSHMRSRLKMNLKPTSKPLLFLVIFFLSGCEPLSSTISPTDPIDLTSTPILVSIEETPPAYPVETPDLAPAYPGPPTIDLYPSAYPAVKPTVEDGPIFTTAPSATFAPEVASEFTPTATLPPYTGKPFTIIYNYGNLWLAEIGGKIERQLTYEPDGWSISRYDINPSGDQIAYVSLKHNPEIADGMIKLLDLRTGEVKPLLGMGDGVIEYKINWLDDTHLAYSYEEFEKYHISTPEVPTPIGGYHSYYFHIYDLISGESTYTPRTIDISQSPNGRYQLTCIRSKPLEEGCEFNLHDMNTQTTWAIDQASNWGWFEGWSSDSHWMLFKQFYNSPGDHKYLIVDTSSQLSTWVDTDGGYCISTSWAFHSAVIACGVCEVNQGCQIRFWGPDGFQAKPPILLPKPFQVVSWTADDTRLLLFPEEYTLWVINLDGTGLREVSRNSNDWKVLP